MCRTEHLYAYSIHEDISNASKTFLTVEKKSPESPCLSDMQSRLKRLMNSQVALQGLVWATPPQTHIHTHIKHTSACTRIKTRQLARPQWSTRQSNVSGICSCLVWRVFPTLPPSPGSRQNQLPQWWERRPLWRTGGGLYSYWGKRDGEREREQAWMIMWKCTAPFINKHARWSCTCWPGHTFLCICFRLMPEPPHHPCPKGAAAQLVCVRMQRWKRN